MSVYDDAMEYILWRDTYHEQLEAAQPLPLPGEEVIRMVETPYGTVRVRTIGDEKHIILHHVIVHTTLASIGNEDEIENLVKEDWKWSLLNRYAGRGTPDRWHCFKHSTKKALKRSKVS